MAKAEPACFQGLKAPSRYFGHSNVNRSETNMKIMAPLSNEAANEVRLLVESGADELYCGYIPLYWRETNGVYSANRRGYGSSVHRLEELSHAISQAHDVGARLYVTVNEKYVACQREDVLRVLKDIRDANADGVIAGDIAVVLLCAELGLPVHAGTGCINLNTNSVLHVAGLGARRVVLDRVLTVSEIEMIAHGSAGTVELEVFILNAKCGNIEGCCSFSHTLSECVAEVSVPDGRIAKRHVPDIVWCGSSFEVEHGNERMRESERVMCPGGGLACGACRIWEFSRCGITGCKVVGRNYELPQRVSDVRFIRKCCDILSVSANQEAFQAMCRREYCARHDLKECPPGRCYYA